jgi:nicotinamide-nucleotide amidase
MPAAILSLGTELTRGEVVNGNGAWLAEHLTRLGHEVIEIATVDDDDERIEATLRRLGREASVIVCTGGLGPTTDDRTAACVARALGVPLQQDELARSQLERALLQRGRTLGPDNEKQAYVPRGATIVENLLGTAPGFGVGLGQAVAYFLPGVPSEMRAMFERVVQPSLPQASESWLALHLATAGLAESEVGQRLAGIEERYQVTIGYRAAEGSVKVKVLVRATPETTAEARDRMEAAWATAIQRLGPAVFSKSAASIEQVLGDLLRTRGLSIGFSESCTAGGASALLGSVPGASRYLRGGVVAYDNRVKTALLGVSEATLAAHGAVSAEVASVMALGARRALGADVGVGITGVAGPDGGSDEKPVGLVHWAVSWQDQLTTFQARFSGSRTDVQRRAAHAALFSAWQVVEGAV